MFFNDYIRRISRNDRVRTMELRGRLRKTNIPGQHGYRKLHLLG